MPRAIVHAEPQETTPTETNVGMLTTKNTTLFADPTQHTKRLAADVFQTRRESMSGMCLRETIRKTRS